MCAEAVEAPAFTRGNGVRCEMRLSAGPIPLKLSFVGCHIPSGSFPRTTLECPTHSFGWNEWDSMLTREATGAPLSFAWNECDSG